MIDLRAVYRDHLRRHPAEQGAGPEVYDDDEVEFLKAVDAYRTLNRRRFPALTELLAILKSLGYGKPTA